MSILESIHCRNDLLKLNTQEIKLLCDEIRHFLVEKVSASGGHLASNLGIVEATVALHLVFDTSVDRLIFDVGHQCYVHKILTDRLQRFDTLRKFGGLSGFPKPEESIHDAFIAGHASNAVSVALGMVRGNRERQVIALVGDGALTGGLAYEGLNNLGASGEHVIVLLNDNGMSIAKNVGGVSGHLKLLRMKPSYFRAKRLWRQFTKTVPGGKSIYQLTHKMKDAMKRGLIGTTLFEEMGMTYYGPVDGHDVKKLAYYLKLAKEQEGPVLVHIHTQKGRGYRPAELEPEKYHGVSPFDPNVGVLPSVQADTFSHVFGEELTALAAKDPRIHAITAAMPQGTGLDLFASKFPDRFFDVGIAEGHAVAMAAGMAGEMCIPVVALYSTFLQRGYDMLLHDIALTNAHVVFAVDRCGLVGEDGSTHHGIFDVNYLRQVPGMTVYSPATARELCKALRAAVEDCTGPVAIRYPRGCCMKESELASAVCTEHADVTILTYGTMLREALTAAAALRTQHISCNIVPLYRIKPLPTEEILQAAKHSDLFVIPEDTVATGSLGQEIAALLGTKVPRRRCLLVNLGDSIVPQGSVKELLHHCGLDGEALAKQIAEAFVYEK